MRAIALAAVFHLLSVAAHSQDAAPCRSGPDPVQCQKDLPGTNHCYRLYPTEGAPKGMVVLLPGFGDPTDYFDRHQLPRILVARGILVVGMGMAGYLAEADVETLHGVVSRIAAELNVPPGTTVIGGMSAGGAGSLLYAERCARGGCDARVRPVAAFSVDGPLDLLRWWDSQELTLRRLGEGASKEDRFEPEIVLTALRNVLGGPPETHRAAYLRQSPFSAREPKGGNAALLRDLPIRAYAEPDVVWTIDTWQRDYLTMNWVDQAALILELKMMGNKQAQLITTTARGSKKGQRSPHSWTIVDEVELADWIEAVIAGKMRG